MKTLLASFYFFYFSIVGVYIIFLPKVLAGFEYSASEIGMIFAAAPLVRFILPFIFMSGFELSVKRFNIALVIMLVGSIAFYIFSHDFYPLLLSNILLGIGLSLILPYVEVISLQSMGKEKYGRIRLFGSVGFVLVALVLAQFLNDPKTALKFLMVLTLLTALVAFVIGGVAKRKDVSPSESKINDINLLKDWKLWGGLILMQVSFGSFYNFFTIYSTNNGITLDMTVYLWSFGVFVEIVMLYFQGALLRGNLLAILQFTTFISFLRWFLVFAFPQNLTILFFSQSLHALSFALFHSAAISYLFVFYKHKSLAQQLFSGITYGLGGFIGALISGYVYEWYPEQLFLSSSLMAFGAFAFLRLWSQDVKSNRLGEAQTN